MLGNRVHCVCVCVCVCLCVCAVYVCVCDNLVLVVRH